MNDDGGPAFPEIRTQYSNDDHKYTGNVYSEGGMTLRDYFAAKAMQALLVNACRVKVELTDEQLSMTAYRVAASMLKARQA